MDAADRAERAEPRLPARQPRRGDPRRHGLRRHARRLPRRARREGRRRALGGARRRQPDRPRDHRRAARRRRQGDRRHQRRRGRHPRLPRRLRREDRQAGLALLDRAVARRAGQRHVAGRQLGARRRRDVAHRLLRSGAEAALLGHRQSRSRLERRLAQGRQPLHLARWSRSTSRPARRAGISSSRRTTSTTGTRTRSRCSSTPRSAAGRDALVVTANRNGFYYVLDRKTGEFLLGTPVREADVGQGPRRNAAGRS